MGTQSSLRGKSILRPWRRLWRAGRRVAWRQVWPLALLWLGVMMGLGLLLQSSVPDYGPAAPAFAPSPSPAPQQSLSPGQAPAAGETDPAVVDGTDDRSKAALLKDVLRQAIPGLRHVPPPAPQGPNHQSLAGYWLRRFMEAGGDLSLSHPWTLLAAEMPYLKLVATTGPVDGGTTEAAADPAGQDEADAPPAGQGQEELPGEDGEVAPSRPVPLIPLTSWTMAVQTRLGGREEDPLADGAPWRPQGDGPAVFLYHSHGTEAFLGAIPVGGSVQPNVDGFTPDTSRNMVRVGQEVKRVLEEEYGVGVVHVTDLFDWQNDAVTRVGAYYRSLQMLTDFRASGRAINEVYPNLVLLLDLHRDAVPRQQSLVNLSSGQAARLLFLVGTRSQDHPNWQQNLCVAHVLNNILEENFPGMSRGVRKRKERFNQHMLPGALLVEIGSVENTLEEALAAARVLAQVINTAGRQGLLPQPGTPYECPLGPVS